MEEKLTINAALPVVSPTSPPPLCLCLCSPPRRPSNPACAPPPLRCAPAPRRPRQGCGAPAPSGQAQRPGVAPVCPQPQAALPAAPPKAAQPGPAGCRPADRDRDRRGSGTSPPMGSGELVRDLAR
jgi:hypothetical protein